MSGHRRVELINQARTYVDIRALHRCILCLWHEEESANQLGRLLQAPHVTCYVPLQMVGAFQEDTPDAVLLDVVPDLLLRVRFRRVGGRSKSRSRLWVEPTQARTARDL